MRVKSLPVMPSNTSLGERNISIRFTILNHETTYMTMVFVVEGELLKCGLGLYSFEALHTRSSRCLAGK